MKRYYYYVIRNTRGMQAALISTDENEFPLTYIVKKYREDNNEEGIITFWHRVSAEEFERYNEMLNKISI